eukprot:scaffold56968_cov17-Tisochrysis_lutea.AAC.3
MQWKGALKAAACVLLAVYLLFHHGLLAVLGEGTLGSCSLDSLALTLNAQGGAVSYSAVAARALGVKACVLTGVY